MAITVEIIKIEDSLGIVLSDEVLAKLRVGVGDTLYLTPASECVLLTPHSVDDATKLDAGVRIMERYRDTLRKLAE